MSDDIYVGYYGDNQQPDDEPENSEEGEGYEIKN